MSVLCLEESKTKLNCVGIRNVCKQTFAIFEKKQFETWSAAEIAGLIGVTSRRIYDILIICTLLEIVEHSGEKGKYRWNGISELGEVLKRFHKDVLKKQSSLNISSEHDIRLYKTNENEQGEDTMLAICKFILELFLISSCRVYSLEECMLIRRGLSFSDKSLHNTPLWKKQMRRMYEASNILVEFGLLAKMYDLTKRKHCIAWVGGKFYPLPITASEVVDSRFAPISSISTPQKIFLPIPKDAYQFSHQSLNKLVIKKPLKRKAETINTENQQEGYELEDQSRITKQAHLEKKPVPNKTVNNQENGNVEKQLQKTTKQINFSDEPLFNFTPLVENDLFMDWDKRLDDLSIFPKQSLEWSSFPLDCGTTIETSLPSFIMDYSGELIL